MPLFTVTMKAGRAAGEKNAISRAIHEASIKAGYPDDDMFQRFLCLEQGDLKVDLNYPGLPKLAAFGCVGVFGFWLAPFR